MPALRYPCTESTRRQRILQSSVHTFCHRFQVGIIGEGYNADVVASLQVQAVEVKTIAGQDDSSMLVRIGQNFIVRYPLVGIAGVKRGQYVMTATPERLDHT